MSVSDEEIGAIVSLMRLVPDSGRRFEIDDEIARRQHGLSESLIERLTASGLRHESVNGMRVFDRNDISNASLQLGLPSVRRMAMRTWSRTLQEADKHGEMTAVIQVGAADSTSGIRREIRAEVSVGHAFADEQVAALLHGFHSFVFFMLPEVCRWDLDFITRHGICECGGASRLLLERARRLGTPARQCFGLLVAEPYSTGHYWTEFLVDGKWTAFDPLLLALLHRVTRLPPEQWPVHRSNGAMLYRLCVVERWESNGAPIVEEAIEQAIDLPLKLMIGQTLVATLPTALLKTRVNIA